MFVCCLSSRYDVNIGVSVYLVDKYCSFRQMVWCAKPICHQETYAIAFDALSSLTILSHRMFIFFQCNLKKCIEYRCINAQC